ncbi:terminase small subunit [Lutimaribacter marinistellae]|uniref:Terminase small subunit n=1 Tax=Lutimaribacter marinistellae TaxID=1820329 RepID=A0ABV7TIL7_9RHOB
MTDNPALADTAWLDQHTLNDRQRRFVLAYLETSVAAQAAEKAGYKQPHVQGPRLLSNVVVKAAIADGRSQIEQKAMLDATKVAELWAEIATADPNELTQHIHAPCRYCHGIDHAYQWKTKREFTEAKAAAVFDLYSDDALREAAMAGQIEDARIPDDAGGYGYRLTDDPNPDCPECSGFGIEITRMADTRKLKGGARILFDGVKETKQGIEIKMQDRGKALENLAKHFGMFAGKVDAEEVSPLERLVSRLVSNENAVPVRPDPEPQDASTAPAHPLDGGADDHPAND